MRQTPLLLLAFILTITARGQQAHKRKYLDANLHFTTKRNSAYTATAVPEAGRWILTAVYRNNATLLTMSFADDKLTIKDGDYILYHPNGVVWQKGRFKNDMAEGCWQSWYDNGQASDSGSISKNQFCGMWKHWWDNGHLKNIHTYSDQPADLYLPIADTGGKNDDHDLTSDPNAAFVRLTGTSNGRWQSWYENGRLESEGFLRNDTPAGVWKWFRENGNPSTVETYVNGKISDLQCYDENGIYSGNSCSILKPAIFTHPYMSVQQYISDQLIRLYGLHRYDIGKLRLRFIITKTGEIAQLSISCDPNIDLQVYLIHILTIMPAWSAAISHNRVVDYPVSVQVY